MDTSGFDLLQTAVLLLDESSRILYANAAAEECLHASSRQLEGQPAEPLLAALPSVLKTRLPGDPSRWLLEISMHQSQRLEDLQHAQDGQAAQRETLRNLAHEIRNPLAGLMAAAQLLEMELRRDDLREYTQVIVAEAERLAHLVDQLASSGQTSPERRTFNVHEVCERVLALVGMEFGPTLRIQRDYDASLPEMRADRDGLMQALLNIARNGAQAMMEAVQHEPALLGVRTRVVHQPLLMDRQPRMGLLIAVTDNGPGVPEGLRDKLFHPLVTGRANGTGLGLSLAQESLQQMGGVLEFNSRPGHTEFRLLLPLERA